MAKQAGRGDATAADERSALEIARSIQRPGQTKEQTKLIARGIEQGIAQYKKRHAAKARELDRRLKQAARQEPAPQAQRVEPARGSGQRLPWLPWLLLALSWAGVAAYLVLRG